MTICSQLNKQSQQLSGVVQSILLPTRVKKEIFFINLNTQTFFGPKKSNNWGTGIVLSGSNGQNGVNGTDGKDGKDGQNGNTLLSGVGAPSSLLGTIGDFYFGTEALAIYGAKISTGWGTPVSLKPNAAATGIRILIKENVNFPNLDAYIRISQSNGLYSVACDDFPISVAVGDIKNYLDNGAVILQTKINGGFWMPDHVYLRLEGEEYEFSFENNINDGMRYDGINLIFSTNYAYLSGNFNTSNEAKAKLLSELEKTNVSYKIILIPASSVEKIASQYPSNIVDGAFLSKYYRTIVR